MFKILALTILSSSIIYYAFNALWKPKAKSKTTMLIKQAEDSVIDAQDSVNKASNSLQKLQLKNNDLVDSYSKDE